MRLTILLNNLNLPSIILSAHRAGCSNQAFTKSPVLGYRQPLLRGIHMNKPYDLLTMCLFEVKKSNLPQIKKLQIEVQLYQLKRLVITTEAPLLTGCAPCENDFTALHHRIKNLCGRDAGPGEANDLVKHMMAMKASQAT